MFSVFRMLRIKSLVEIFHVHNFNCHVTLQTVNHMGKAPFAQLSATSLSHFSFHVVARNKSMWNAVVATIHFTTPSKLTVNIGVAGMLLQFGLMWWLNPFYKSILSKCIFVQLQFKWWFIKRWKSSVLPTAGNLFFLIAVLQTTQQNVIGFLFHVESYSTILLRI